VVVALQTAAGRKPRLAPERSIEVRGAMRSYVRRWINEWDLLRLHPDAQLDTLEERLQPSYEEDVTLQGAVVEE